MYNAQGIYAKQLANMIDAPFSLGDESRYENVSAWLRIAGVYGADVSHAKKANDYGLGFAGLATMQCYPKFSAEALAIVGDAMPSDDLKHPTVGLVPHLLPVHEMTEGQKIVHGMSCHINPFAMIATAFPADEAEVYELPVTPLKVGHMNVPNSKIEAVNRRADLIRNIQIKGWREFSPKFGSPDFGAVTAQGSPASARQKKVRPVCMAGVSATSNFNSINLFDMDAIFSSRPEVAVKLIGNFMEHMEWELTHRDAERQLLEIRNGVSILPLGEHENGGAW